MIYERLLTATNKSFSYHSDVFSSVSAARKLKVVYFGVVLPASLARCVPVRGRVARRIPSVHCFRFAR